MSKSVDQSLLNSSSRASFADVAHQTLHFDRNLPNECLVLNLLDCSWVQRLRQVRQTGNTYLVYMFAEHSRFGHSLGVAYLACSLMRQLASRWPDSVEPYRNAVSAAALLHDVGHVAPGSHLAERVWRWESRIHHETLTTRIIREDPSIAEVLAKFDAAEPETVASILSDQNDLPHWTSAILHGGGWNADRGNWSIVDSAMCSVSYGRYNVSALLDSFRLNEQGELLIGENRLDALTHFYVARDSMYRQVYQHRVLQVADRMTELLIARLRELAQLTKGDFNRWEDTLTRLEEQKVYCDPLMGKALSAADYSRELSLEDIFGMVESWFHYHLFRWCEAKDEVLRNLACSLRDRRLFKTIRLSSTKNSLDLNSSEDASADDALIRQAKITAENSGFNPDYFVTVVEDRDRHRASAERVLKVLLENGDTRVVTEVEPLINTLLTHAGSNRRWLAVPKIVKEKIGRPR